MGFDSGSLTFRRFKVIGESPRLPDEEAIEKFAALALREGEETTSDIDYGWCGPRHVLDGDFGVGGTVYNDCITVGLRIDTNRVPADIKRAYVAMEESTAAASNPSGFASKRQRKEAKDAAKKKIEEDLASGKFRRSKMIPVLWDLPNSTLYAPVGGASQEQLIELFERTQNLTLERMTSGAVSLSILEARDMRREYEDITPTRFAAIAGNPPAEYPWTAKGDQAKDFLGNEFLLWLWNEAGSKGGELAFADERATVMFSKSIDLDCVYGQSGRTTNRFEVPTEMPESIDALRAGKVPRKAGLTIALHGQLYTLSLGGEGLTVGGLKLPDVEKADSARVLFEERITLLRDFTKGLDAIFAAFLTLRASSRWQEHVSTMSRWISGQGRSSPVAA